MSGLRTILNPSSIMGDLIGTGLKIGLSTIQKNDRTITFWDSTTQTE